MYLDEDSRPSYSDDDNSQNLSAADPDEFIADPQHMNSENDFNAGHIYYGNADDDEYPSYVHIENELRVVPDDTYMEDLNIYNLKPFPSIVPAETEQDLLGLVTGVMMANGSKLDSGLDAAEFDLQLQEVTGGQMNMMGLAAFMKISNEEVDAINKQKGNLLLHDIFKSFLYYSAADGTFKLNPPPHLKELRETIKLGSACKDKRREKADLVKSARMLDPEFRKKLMISNNFLVELIVYCCNSLFTTEVTWQQLQTEYKKMMKEETALYAKYQQPLRLGLIRENIGTTLNSKACRELFGRGTVSRALSSEIFSKIKWTNKENQLILHLDGDYRRNLEQFTYGAEHFKEIQVRIDNKKAMRDAETTQRPEKPRHPSRLEREQQELEERKKIFEAIQAPNVFMPSLNEMEHRFHPGNNFRNNPAVNTTRATVNNVFGGVVDDPATEAPSNHDPSEAEKPCETPSFFGGTKVSRSISDDSMSDTGLPTGRDAVNFTDDEDEGIKPERQAVAAKKEEQAKLAPKVQDVLSLFGDAKLLKKNESLVLPEKVLRDKIVGIFFSSISNPMARLDTKALKTFHATMKTSGEPFEVVYVSYDNNVDEFNQYIREQHGDWLFIPFGIPKLDEIKAKFADAAFSQLHILKPDGTCATKHAIDQIKLSRNPKACFNKCGNSTKTTQPSHREEKDLPQIVPASASRWEVPVKPETATEKRDRMEQWRVGKTIQPETSIYGSSIFEPRQHPPTAPRNRLPSGSVRNVRLPTKTPIKAKSTRHDIDLNISEDPSLMSHSALFIQHIKTHVFLHRHIDGTPVRYWSRIKKYLPSPFDMPAVILGDDWINSLMETIPAIHVTTTPHGDYLFDWVDKNSKSALLNCPSGNVSVLS